MGYGKEVLQMDYGYSREEAEEIIDNLPMDTKVELKFWENIKEVCNTIKK